MALDAQGRPIPVFVPPPPDPPGADHFDAKPTHLEVEIMKLQAEIKVLFARIAALEKKLVDAIPSA